MIDYISLYNKAKSYSVNLQNKLGYSDYNKRDVVFEESDTISDNLISWINYFLHIECNATCLKVIDLYFSTDENRTIKEVSEECGVAPNYISISLGKIYKVVIFCDTYLSDTEFSSLESRIKLKMYDKIFMVEFLHKAGSKTFINTLRRYDVLTLKDLINKDVNILLNARGINETTLLAMSKKLHGLGITEFDFKPKDKTRVTSSCSSEIRQASTKEEAIEVLLRYVESKGCRDIAKAFRETWVTEY